MSAHTPGPWRAVPSTCGGGTARRDVVSDGAEFSPSFVAGDILIDDAEFIVRACNCHAELLAALHIAIKLQDRTASLTEDETEAVCAAITKAEGKPHPALDATNLAPALLLALSGLGGAAL